jgi:hypothetical protein
VVSCSSGAELSGHAKPDTGCDRARPEISDKELLTRCDENKRNLDRIVNAIVSALLSPGNQIEEYNQIPAAAQSATKWVSRHIKRLSHDHGGFALFCGHGFHDKWK